MKTELLVFQDAVHMAHKDGLLSQHDYVRMVNSIQGKGIGFVQDLDELAQCVREGLSIGTFRLTERLNKVFRRPSKHTALPVFLQGLLARIFHSNGELRSHYDAHIAASVITLLSALKRIDPPRAHYSALESKVWTTLESNFKDSSDVKDRVINHDLSAIRTHFQALLPSDIGPPELVFGPGANIDKLPSATSSDWILSDTDLNVPEGLREYFKKLVQYSRYTPRIGRRRRTLRVQGEDHRFWYVDKLSHDRPKCEYPDTAIMRCSAQPKSYKALRGVGVMHIARMSLQLSLQRHFYRCNDSVNMPLTNQGEMARNLVSSPQPVGTLDASSASDRKFWWLLDLLGIGNAWYEACRSVRTRVLQLPGRFIVCEAPIMGEPITFPLMSAYYCAVALYVCDLKGYGHESVRVYGDDVQTPHYHETMELLTFLGDNMSPTKSYPPESNFKESCESHFIRDPHTGQYVDARPAYIPSGRLFGSVRRGRISRSDTYKLIILARDAFYRSGYVSHGAISIVERYSMRLPDSPITSNLLGKPTYTRSSTTELRVHLKEDDMSSLTVSGSARHALRDPARSYDRKLSSKMEFKIMVANIDKFTRHDSFDRFEYHLLCHILTRWDEYLTGQSINSIKGKGQIMHASAIQQNPNARFKDALSYLRTCVWELPDNFVAEQLDRLISML